MLKALVVLGLLAVGLLVGLAALVVVPLLLVGALLKVLFLAVTLPFRIAGGLVLVLGKLVVFLALLGFGIVLFVGGIFAVPLVPILLLFGVVWLLTRVGRRPAPVPASQATIDARPL